MNTLSLILNFNFLFNCTNYLVDKLLINIISIKIIIINNFKIKFGLRKIMVVKIFWINQQIVQVSICLLNISLIIVYYKKLNVYFSIVHF